jgi:hypothetical protein
MHLGEQLRANSPCLPQQRLGRVKAALLHQHLPQPTERFGQEGMVIVDVVLANGHRAPQQPLGF